MILRSKIFILILVCVLCGTAVQANSQEARVNQKKIQRQREKKQKEAVKQYEQAVKRHYNNQSNSTKKSMKQLKRESKDATPVKR